MLILLLTDGALDDRTQSLATLKRIKENPRVTVSAMHFQKEVDEDSEYYSWDEKTGELDYSSSWTIEEVKENQVKIGERFREFASNDTYFLNTLDPEEVRKHMIKSVSSTSKLDI